MIDIQKLATLTGLHLSQQEQEKFGHQLESVVHLLEKVKHFETQEQLTNRHELLSLHTAPRDSLTPDSTTQELLNNTAYPLVGQAIEVAKFVE